MLKRCDQRSIIVTFWYMDFPFNQIRSICIQRIYIRKVWTHAFLKQLRMTVSRLFGFKASWYWIMFIRYLVYPDLFVFHSTDLTKIPQKSSRFRIGFISNRACNIGIIFYCIWNSQWCIYNTQSRSDCDVHHSIRSTASWLIDIGK